MALLFIHFDNETEKGKLYISYPMVEALKHIEKDAPFMQLYTHSYKEYKAYVNKNCLNEYKHFNRYTKSIWQCLVDIHGKKANYLVNQRDVFPESIFTQLVIFHAQKQYLSRSAQMGVLSAFPLFLLDYFGINYFSVNSSNSTSKP